MPASRHALKPSFVLVERRHGIGYRARSNDVCGSTARGLQPKNSGGAFRIMGLLVQELQGNMLELDAHSQQGGRRPPLRTPRSCIISYCKGFGFLGCLPFPFLRSARWRLR